MDRYDFDAHRNTLEQNGCSRQSRCPLPSWAGHLEPSSYGQVARAPESVMEGAAVPNGLKYSFTAAVSVSVTRRVYSTLVVAAAKIP